MTLETQRCGGCGCEWMWPRGKPVQCPACNWEPEKPRVYFCNVNTRAISMSVTVYGTDMRAALKALRRQLKDESFEPVEITIKLTDLEPQL